MDISSHLQVTPLKPYLHVEMADEALEKTIASVFRTGEEVNRITQNNSSTRDNGTRQILTGVGSSHTDLGNEIRDTDVI